MAAKVLMDLPKTVVKEMKRKKQAKIRALRKAYENNEQQVFKPKNMTYASKEKILEMIRKPRVVEIGANGVSEIFGQVLEVRGRIERDCLRFGRGLVEFDGVLDRIEEMIENVPTK